MRMVKIMNKIIENFELKSVSALGLSFASFFFDSLHTQALIAVLILVVFDFVTAIHATFKTQEKIESAKIFRTAVKIATYFLLISSGYIAEKTVPLSFLDESVIAFLAMTELISIMENTAKAGYAIPIKLLEKLKSYQNP